MNFLSASFALGCDEATIRAVFEVEAAGAFFDINGAPVARFEPHKFPRGYWTMIKFDPGDAAPWRASLKIRKGERERMFAQALEINREHALQATSIGAPQIMGSNAADAGYSSACDMYDSFVRGGDAEQVMAFVCLIKSWGLDSNLRAQDWLGFARRYNGTGRARTYANRIERAYKRLTGEATPVVLKAGSRGADVRRLQDTLTDAGYPVDVDGNFGNETTNAVRAFQRAQGLKVDGMVGRATWARLTSAPPKKTKEARLGLSSKRVQGAIGSVAGAGAAISQAQSALYVVQDGAALVPEGVDTQTVIIGILGVSLVGVVGWMLWTRWKDSE